jgi:deazaflavin-dependent oxidoreductase (nitroreductase family)
MGARDPGAARHPSPADVRSDIGAELAAWGKVILLETRGRQTARRRVAPVGFVEEPDGCLLVAATDEHTHWARNLMADPRCRVTRDGATEDRRAEPLEEAARSRAVVALILRYGTPAERLGAGPAFRLRRTHAPEGR